MKPTVDIPLARYDPVPIMDIEISRPLSGYLGGGLVGGYWVERLESEWCEAFGVRHAVAVNSATSGLLIACLAAGIKKGDRVITTPFTMSATAAAPKFLGADIDFRDIELGHYCLNPRLCDDPARVIIATNLFGHPARLEEFKDKKVVFIEDNAQAPFASEAGKFTGTVGHMGVFSLNVHKHFHCGEGGVVVTNNSGLAEALRLYRNHGEMVGGPIGLNLRMTELSAAVACSQLWKARHLVQERADIAEAILDQTRGIPGIGRPLTREKCRHVYYCIPFFVAEREYRDWCLEALRAEGVPLQAGYVKPLYHLNAFRDSFTGCRNAEMAHDSIMLYENCAYTPTREQIRQIGDAFKKVAERKWK